MRKIISLVVMIICVLSSTLMFGCQQSSDGAPSDKCAKCVKADTTKVVYKLDGEFLNVGNPCEKCGYVIDPQQSIAVDYAVSKSNDVTVAQEDADRKQIDCTIVLKKGEYDTIYLNARYNGSTKFYAETGVDLRLIEVQGDIYDVTIENVHFYCEPGVRSGGINFGNSATVDDTGNKAYMDVTVRNCSFYGDCGIQRGWADGIVENLLIENCTFTNNTNDHDDYTGSAYTPIFIGEIAGDTIFRDNVFTNSEYGMIRLGTRTLGCTGTITIENNVFDIARTSRPVQISANEDCIVNVENNSFNYELSTNFLRFSYKSGVDRSTIQFNVYSNKFNVIPNSIANATYYNPLEQEYLD